MSRYSGSWPANALRELMFLSGSQTGRSSELPQSTTSQYVGGKSSVDIAPP